MQQSLANGRRTEASLPDLFCGKGKHREHLGHYPYDQTGHSWLEWDLDVNTETTNEICNAFE